MELLVHPQLLQLTPSIQKKRDFLRRSINCCFFCKSSRTHRHIVSPPKHASSVTSPYFPITVLYEDKPGKPTPYDLVLKSNATIADVRLLFLI
jgi:hypothetical protein